MEFESITKDAELASIKAINEVFPKIKHFNCYFHYKQDLIRRFKKEGLYKKRKKSKVTNECQHVINSFNLLPLQYNRNINLINKILGQSIQNYPNFKNILINYFKNNKLPYFISGDYNYKDLPSDCRSNCDLENYYLYMKKNLGRKYKLR